MGLHLSGFLVRGVSILKTKYDAMDAITYRPEWQVARWYDELLEDIREMKACWDKGYWNYNLDESCTHYGGCPFRQICLLKEPAEWLEAMYERRQWFPLTREERVLLPSGASLEQ